MKEKINKPSTKWIKVRLWIPKGLKSRPDYKVYRWYESGGGYITLVMDRLQKLVEKKPNLVIDDFDALYAKKEQWEIAHFSINRSLYDKLVSMVNVKSIEANNKKIEAVIQYLYKNNYF